MKPLASLLLTLVLTAAVPGAGAAEAQSPARARAAKRGNLVHMVAFKFKPEAGAEKIREVERAFAVLPGKIPQIRSFEWGTNVSPEKLDKGFTHGFILTFDNDADRDAYLVHPAHKAFGELVGPVLADVFVIDFHARE